MKPYSESCDQNREPILDVIRPLLKEADNVLEIGSGTGQHAVYFARHMPHLIWHPSDCKSYLNGIELWVGEAGLDNVHSPFELDVVNTRWPSFDVDAVFTANSIHIMNGSEVSAMLQGVGNLLKQGALFIAYGPFNYANAYISSSNQRFDDWLKQRDPESGIKNFEDICNEADGHGLSLLDDIEMPVNNRILVWEKAGAE